ncbi:glutamate decarboxylase [Candidatus Micrarchaeota archaeon CG10_big_fil_rev_8_21_14_0_10_45_29]|nr:MAG: glutamate decarboxylase [Candidatus Micrarchaeota archaeon CG10_big_fil_rev_8_21_14_0_10_45_29]
MKKKIDSIASTYSTRYFSSPIPKYKMPEGEMPPDAAYQLIHDELNLDGRVPLNLASFVTTWMEPQANKLIAENINKNFIDHDEYLQSAEIERRCISMLAGLYNSPNAKASPGASTLGSSEAIMLALLAHKFRWKERMKKKGKSASKPNIVMGADVHTVWDKFARYFDVEPRIIPMKKGKYTINAADVAKLVDENTICVGAILCTTFSGQMDEIEKINGFLIKLKKKKGWDIPMHVDAASGGFIAPFLHPSMKWDFRLERVKSINVSGHKFGLVYPGLGWVIFREKADLPDELVFYVNYLGGEMPTFTLNFSKGSSTVIAQYYNLIRLGKSGYKKIMQSIMQNTHYLAKKLHASGRFSLLCTPIFPVVALKLAAGRKYSVFDVSQKLRERGWIVPAYSLPAGAQEEKILRIVIKENFGRDMADLLCADVEAACDLLEGKASKEKPVHKRKGKHHIC